MVDGLLLSNIRVDNTAQERARSLSVRFNWHRLRRVLLSLLLAAVMMLQDSPLLADSLPPLRADQNNLRGLLSDRLADVRLPPYPVIRPDAPFSAISPYVTGVESLAQVGLAKIPEDATALLDFLQLSLEARLRELGIRNDYQVRPLGPFAEGFDDCNVLGMAIFFGAREIAYDGGRPVVAVTVNTLLWRLVPEPGPSEPSSACSAKEGPSLTNLAATQVFIVERGEREKALALAKDALLSIVDRPILRRLIETNPTALRRVKSWIE